jgi:Sulfotransferase domain
MRNSLFLSVGMPRAGSGWHYNLIHDLVVAGGGQDARQIRQRFHLERFLTEVNCNIGTLKAHRLFPVLYPTILGNSFAIKTHAGPTRTALSLIQRGQIVATYIYRDPRAAMLSAYEYGQRGAKEGRSNAFSELTSLEKAKAFMQRYVAVWALWTGCAGVLTVRYEDMVRNYEDEFDRLAEFLGNESAQDSVQDVFDKYRPERGGQGQKGTHFSKGKAERFRSIFTADQLEEFTQAFQPAIEQMGYSV